MKLSVVVVCCVIKNCEEVRAELRSKPNPTLKHLPTRNHPPQKAQHQTQRPKPSKPTSHHRHPSGKRNQNKILPIQTPAHSPHANHSKFLQATHRHRRRQPNRNPSNLQETISREISVFKS